MASILVTTPRSANVIGFMASVRPCTNKFTCPPPAGKKPRFSHVTSNLTPMRSTVGASTRWRKSSGGEKSTSVPPFKITSDVPPANSNGNNAAWIMSVIAPAVLGSAENVPSRSSFGVHVTSQEPFLSPMSAADETSRTSLKHSKCCAASPGVFRFALMLVIRTGKANIAEYAREFLKIWPPPSSTEPSTSTNAAAEGRAPPSGTRAILLARCTSPPPVSLSSIFCRCASSYVIASTLKLRPSKAPLFF
mmetsp:Transcript_10019/g.26604  ORF Transcript_10019/g.26604 Transcript_10019/m.26604 type:complete len:249 (-) Transcript_10019:552-1298(-)